MKLSPVQRKFILHWGEMGTRWGVNRSVAQIHALLFIAPEPLTAEDLAETLEVARSNVSTSLRELQGWGLVRTVHKLGDRRDHFETLKDVWETYEVVMDQRKRREIDPTLQLLRDCVAEAAQDKAEDAHTRQRLGDLLEFMESVSDWYMQLRRLPRQTFARFIRMGAGVGRLLESVRSRN